jgi:hypothetical protein
MSEDDPYLIPGTTTLRNKLGIVDRKKLDRAERRGGRFSSLAGVLKNDSRSYGL